MHKIQLYVDQKLNKIQIEDSNFPHEEIYFKSAKIKFAKTIYESILKTDKLDHLIKQHSIVHYDKEGVAVFDSGSDYETAIIRHIMTLGVDHD